MESLYEFIEKHCLYYQIDASHGLIHSKKCIRWVELLSESLNDIEKQVAVYAAGLHDMVDKKYTDSKAKVLIHDWLLSQQWQIEYVDALLAIITTLSYSYLMEKGSFPDHGKWNTVYHIVRHADLLEGMTVARCYLYNKHLYPEREEDLHWQNVTQLFQKRMFRYVLDGWISIPKACSFATELKKQAEYDLIHRVSDY
jgi:hypothetical protein